MRTVRHYNESDLEKALRELLAKEGLVVKSARFSATPKCDAMDRPTGSYEVSAEVEVLHAAPGDARSTNSA
jgi:hypothetical protein